MDLMEDIFYCFDSIEVYGDAIEADEIYRDVMTTFEFLEYPITEEFEYLLWTSL